MDRREGGGGCVVLKQLWGWVLGEDGMGRERGSVGSKMSGGTIVRIGVFFLSCCVY